MNEPLGDPGGHDGGLARVGRFVVKLPGATHVGLAAHEVQELLTQEAESVQEIFRIHRVFEDGNMDLVGVSAADLEQRDCMIFRRDNARSARGDYDAIVSFAEASAPPCRIVIHFSNQPGSPPVHQVALIYPAACGEAVGQWLTDIPVNLGDSVASSPAVLHDYEAASPQLVKTMTIEP